MKRDKRDWLNESNRFEKGFVISSGNVDVSNNTNYRTKKKYKYAELDGSLSIGDCYRSVNLDFHVDADLSKRKSVKRALKSVSQRRQKLEIIRQHLDNIENGLDEIEEILSK